MKTMMKLSAMVLMLQMLCGCWDVKNIEKLSFARGLAIDETDDHQYKLTYQNLLPQSEDSQASGKPEFVNVTSYGKTVLEAVSDVSIKDPPIYSDHLKVILLGEKLMRNQNIDQVFNHFIRDDELRRSSYLMAARGKAGDIFTKGSPKQQLPMPSEKLIDLTNNSNYNGKIMMPLRIGRASIYCQNGYSFLIQAVNNQKGKAKYDGAGIIKSGSNKLVGFLSAEEIQTLTWVMGTIQGGVMPTTDKGHPITFEIKKSKSKIKPAIENGKPVFQISVKTKGILTEDQSPNENSFRKNYLHRLENIFEKKLEHDVKKVMDKLQHEYKSDPIFLSDYIRIQHPEYWHKVKGHWDVIFSDADFKYDISFKIVNFGTAGQ
ncbi:Ger(x)C family spore germination protein [Bacillus sp. C28GYM-DRY-1]|uniref:Ger(x)C family spore germination protein n=1 Tax=Bacillus sp. C28GYM-DRY-1 TaxID=3062686 RepID=UPI002674A5BC|nr:Ger(x)C family spore germination protein [Bacillus sp. C28GYM-DRY-1]MDO3659865.1 Ger(x)C family spore germination protein [Bacillus sp. C28GYM-DRY-1]